jgi:hypothetical protein
MIVRNSFACSSRANLPQTQSPFYFWLLTSNGLFEYNKGESALIRATFLPGGEGKGESMGAIGLDKKYSQVGFKVFEYCQHMESGTCYEYEKPIRKAL